MIALPKGFIAARPEILSVLTSVEIKEWGTPRLVVDFEGTAEELIAAGACDAHMLNPSGGNHRRGRDEFGDKFNVTRRAKGRFELSRWFYEEPSTDSAGPGRGWSVLGPRVLAEVGEALQRMRRPRKEGRS